MKFIDFSNNFDTIIITGERTPDYMQIKYQMVQSIRSQCGWIFLFSRFIHFKNSSNRFFHFASNLKEKKGQ